MISKHLIKGTTWIDIDAPSREEIIKLREEYEIPDLVAEELISKTVRAKVDAYSDLIYLILHFPKVDSKGRRASEVEVDFVITKEALITVHYEPLPALHRVDEHMATIAPLGHETDGKFHSGHLFFAIVRALYRSISHDLTDMNSLLSNIEKEIFDGKEEIMVHEISSTNRVLLDVRQAIRFHHDMIKSFEIPALTFYGNDYAYYISSLLGEYGKVENILNGHRDMLYDLRDTNNSLLTTKTNETMKVLTIMTFIFLPLTLVAGIFGMNTDFSIIKDFGDLLMVLGLMAMIGLVMYMYFKEKRWL